MDRLTGKTVRVALNVMPTVKNRLEAEAKEKGLTVNAYLNFIITNEFRQLDALKMANTVENMFEKKLKEFSDDLIKKIEKRIKQ